MVSTGVKRLAGRSALGIAAVLVGSWLLVLALGTGIPLDALRTPVEALLSRTLNQVVRVEGPIVVRPTFVPSLVMHELRIDAAPGVQGRDRLLAGQVEMQLGLFSLLRGSPRPARLQARDVTVYLEHADIGAAAPPPAAARDWLMQPELELSLHNLVLNYRADATGPPLRLAFEQLTGTIVTGRPLQLTVSGRLGSFPYVAAMTLPPPAVLLRPHESWSWQGGIDLAGTRLQLQGMLVPPIAGQGPFMKFDLQGGPAVAAEAAQDTAAGPGIAGRFTLQLKDGRPQLDGELQLADLAWLVANGSGPVRAAAPGWLQAIDAGLVVNVNEISNLPVAVRDTRVTLVLRDGQLTAPVVTVIAGVPFHGNVLFDTQADMPLIAASLAAADIDVATLLHGLPGIAGVQGNVAHIELHAAVLAGGAAGEVAGVDAGMQVSDARLSYGNTPGSLPVTAVIDELALSVPAGAAMTMTVHGVLASAPLALEWTGGSLETLLQEKVWPVSLRATSRGATLNASGTLASSRDSADTTLSVEVAGERLGDLAPWIGVAACTATPYTARGQLLLTKNVGRLPFLEVQFGGTLLTGELDWSRDESVPLLHVVLHADTLYPADVAGLLPVMSYAGDADSASGIVIDMPVLPRPAVIANADIDLTVAQIAHGLVDITEVSFSGQLRDGVFRPSPFSAGIGSRVLQGQLDTSGADTGVAFEISVDDAGSGNLFDRLFSSAVQWVGNAGVVPLRWLFGQGLPGSVAQECPSGDAVSRDAPEQ